MLETEIIQGYHGDKDNRERQNLQKKYISILGCDKCYRKRSRVFVCVLNGFDWKGEQRNAAASRAQNEAPGAGQNVIVEKRSC